MTTTDTAQQPADTADWEVQCLQCHLIGPPSLIPDIGYGPHCADIDSCSKRFGDGGLPQESLPPAPQPEGDLEPLPIEEAASAAQEAARQRLAAWGADQDLSEEEGVPEAAEDVPEEPGEAPAAPEADPGTDAPAAGKHAADEVPD